MTKDINNKKYKIGLTVGVFDIFHVGHLNLLERCKEQCEYLIVGICGDDYVRSVKNKNPVYNEVDRKRILSALQCVDEVIPISIEEIENKLLFLQKIKFNVLFSGSDWKDSNRYKITEEQFSQLGISIEYMPYTKGISTTQISDKLNLYLNNNNNHFD